MAIVAGGRCVVAVVAGNLDEALLGGGGGETAGGAEEALAGEFEDGVILRGGPIDVAGADAGLHYWVFAGGGAGVEPREDDVDGEIGHARGAEQRAGFGLTRAAEGPVMFPKRFRLHGKRFVEGGGELGFRAIDLQPLLEARGEIIARQPMGEQGEAADGMIGRT